MPTIEPTYDTPANAFVVSVVECVTLMEKLFTNRLRMTFSESGTVTVWLTVRLPRPGKTLSDSFSLRRYGGCPCTTRLVRRGRCPAHLPRPPRPPPKPPPKPPRPPPPL